MAEQYIVTGPSFSEDRFLRPEELGTQIGGRTFATFEEARVEARVLHQQFGDAFAIWLHDRIVAIVPGR